MEGIISAVFPGMASMRNFHPLLVHFPIALLNAFILMEVLGVILRRGDMRTAATWMLYLGTLGAAAAVGAGLYAYATVPHPDEVHRIMERHMFFGLVVLAIAIVLSVWRLRVRGTMGPGAWAVHIIVAVVMSVVMTFGADLGGLMVYKYGIGTTAVEFESAQGAGEGHSHGGADGH